jgi:hypothetical protein
MYFFIGKQKVVLFRKYRKNGWESAASSLRSNKCDLDQVVLSTID